MHSVGFGDPHPSDLAMWRVGVQFRTLSPAMLLSARCFVESDSGGDSLEQIPFML
jgi:hypothetical protein